MEKWRRNVLYTASFLPPFTTPPPAMNVTLADPCALEIASVVAQLILNNQTSASTNSIIIQGVQLGTTVVLGAVLSFIHRTHILDFFTGAQSAAPPLSTTPTAPPNTPSPTPPQITITN